jgi:DNA-binding Xre family transcriptional regulator
MIKPNIRQIAEKNGVTTAYQLQKKLGIQPSLAAKWYRNDLKMIGFESLNSLCSAFNCTPNDILAYVAGTESAQISNTELRNDTQTGNTQSSNESDNGNIMTFADALSKFEQIGKPKSASSLRRYLQSKKLKGERLNGEWEIKKSDFENFINSDFFKNLK